MAVSNINYIPEIFWKVPENGALIYIMYRIR